MKFAIILIAIMVIATVSSVTSSIAPHQAKPKPVHHTSMYYMEHDICSTLHATTGFPLKKCKVTAH